ncbi:metallophosphoesterase family protein [Paenibacillus dendritiformis]|uniref:metallophosphoesterase family protein n=1 Tax=Paenibacillus dendritiformis TaxID=130049 RepID=UPI00143DDD4B|nr:metallophosphoesterase family protein [Paenibacillus dendritiformis]NKI22714.1 metallophosphoesterase family protein [Paenibacillus dendritiformis]NRG01378.1 metallophosphoesterase family protein [Paenibacillus dendritiformis]
MQSIAIISDIHGNLQALEAVLQDVERQGADRIYCLGDVVGKGPNPAEVVDLIWDHCDVIVRGNWDELVLKMDEDIQFRWHAERLGEKRRSMLAALPFSHDFIMSGRHIRLVHASPQSVYHRVQPWDAEERRLGMFEFTSSLNEPLHPCQSPDVVIYGDIHNAYLQHLHGRTLVNCGSVGNPLDITQASYIMLQGSLGQVGTTEFSIHFHRVPYDIERAVRAAQEADIPGLQPYVRELRTGVYRGLQSGEA